jgi:hypothetical protein
VNYNIVIGTQDQKVMVNKVNQSHPRETEDTKKELKNTMSYEMVVSFLINQSSGQKCKQNFNSGDTKIKVMNIIEQKTS